MAIEKPIVEVANTIMDETENIVTVDQSTAPATRRRNAVAAKQTLFAADDQVVISFLNTIDVQPGDFVAIVPSNIDVSAGMVDGDYVAWGMKATCTRCQFYLHMENNGITLHNS